MSDNRNRLADLLGIAHQPVSQDHADGLAADRIEELEKKIEYLCRDQENYEPILVAENQRLKDTIKAIRELPRYNVRVAKDCLTRVPVVDADELEALAAPETQQVILLPTADEPLPIGENVK